MEPGRKEELELVVFCGADVTRRPLPKQGSLTIGRTEDNDVRIDNSSVSRKHCVLHIGPPLAMEDLRSANGIFVRDPKQRGETNDTQNLRAISGQTVEIAIGDCVNVGSSMVVVRRAASHGARSRPGEDDSFVLRDPGMRALYAQAEKAAVAPISVLILGETGVGKEVLAQHIHQRSVRASGPFLGLNCAALSESLLESELFGNEKGAFTGAVQARPGLFETAAGGTVFLDEVGELPMSIQVKLLRVLEERKVLRVGGRSPIAVDVRFVAATNRDLETASTNGTFRQDLYFRLNGMELTIPPLRERKTEIGPLASYFVASTCRQMDRAEVPGIAPETLDALTRYAWPGNVRELRNVMERAVVLCTAPALRLEDLPASVIAPPKRAELDAEPPPSAEPLTDPMGKLRQEIDALERQRILEALKTCAGNQTHAAELLGISRRTLVTRLAEYDIPRPRKRS